MNEQPSNKCDIVDLRSALQSLESPHGMVKVNRVLLAMVLALMLIVVITGFLLLPKPTIGLQSNASANALTVGADPVLSADVNALKAQMIGLVSGSIESKLRALEEGIRAGSASRSLGALEDLRNDVKVLRSYSQSGEAGDAGFAVNQQVMQEISQLRSLIYVSLASCGLMLAAVAGIWLKHTNKLTYIKVITHYLGKH